MSTPIRRKVQLAWPILLSGFVVMLLPTGAGAQSRLSGTETCSGPTNDVIVMALQDPADQRAHLLVIKNLSEQPIVAILVGDGVKPQLHSSEFAVPLEIRAPSGWTGTHVFKEESAFMHWVWTVKSPEAQIAPHEMVSGFKVTLRPFSATGQNQLYPDGTRMQPITVSELPFRIQFGNGACVWGQIRSLIIASSGR